MTQLTSALIHLDDIHLSLPSGAGQVDILRGVSLDVMPGEAVGLVGPSGSGKSTMLMIMAGLEEPSSGVVEVAGQRLGDLDEDDLAAFRRDNVGIVFQSFHLIATMTAQENVALPLELKGEHDAFRKAREALERVGLGPRISHYPGQLSGGEQQRVALARALIAGGRILLADEPTGNLDQRTGKQVIDLMFDLHSRDGLSLVLITHDEALAARCTRVVRLLDGRIAAGQKQAGTGQRRARGRRRPRVKA